MILAVISTADFYLEIRTGEAKSYAGAGRCERQKISRRVVIVNS